MKTFDFSSLIPKYSLLNGNDVNKLNNFFNKTDIQEKLWKAEFHRKIFMIIKIVVYLIALALIWYFTYLTQNFEILIYWIVWVWFLGWVINIIFEKTWPTIKKDILPLFVGDIDESLEYSSTASLFSESVNSVKTKTSLLHPFDRVDCTEDSVRYTIWVLDNEINIPNQKKDNMLWILPWIIPMWLNWVKVDWDKEVISWDIKVKWSIKIECCEIKTSNKHTQKTKHGTRTYYVTNNHCYMTKIKFLKPRFTIKKWIRLAEDVHDWGIKKYFPIFAVSFLFCFPINLYAHPLLVSFSESYWVHVYLLYLSIFLFSLLFVNQMFKLLEWKNRVVLENLDFEKEFDVFSEDQIESRKVLTPSFMYRIVDFVNKISRNRVYEMYFNGDEIYIKHDLLKEMWPSRIIKLLSFLWIPFTSNKWYLEFSIFKSLFNNLNGYIEFYLELKNITELVRDLNLFYYDQWTFETELINK